MLRDASEGVFHARPLHPDTRKPCRRTAFCPYNISYGLFFRPKVSTEEAHPERRLHAPSMQRFERQCLRVSGRRRKAPTLNGQEASEKICG